MSAVYDVVYFSNISENTKRFVEKLDTPSIRIPIQDGDEKLEVEKPYVLITPTYGNSDRESGIPKQVIKFLNNKKNRDLLRGVIASGNTNFGDKFCHAGELVANKCKVPLLYRFELLGTPFDVQMVNERMEELWKQSH
jgi:protein involved in ribonucleotide reduction